MVKAEILIRRAKEYVKGNPGAPFIIGFMALLLSCGVLLSVGYSAQADRVAECAYYLLIVGVALQFIGFLKEERAKRRENKDNGVK